MSVEDIISVVSGTFRSNLDPFDLHTDAELWDALRRSYLVDTAKRDSLNTSEDGGQDRSINRFTLDSPIEEEGGNLSIGQVSTSTHLERFVS
jgi:ABC-type multidrug transport system fused ATPase/permease subunit